MRLLAGKDKSPVAVLHHQVLATMQGRVIGVLLGHCVFGPQGDVKGKYFNHTLYALTGEMLATEYEMEEKVKLDEPKLLAEGWQVIVKIKDHICPVIEPRSTWTKRSIEQHFTNS